MKQNTRAPFLFTASCCGKWESGSQHVISGSRYPPIQPLLPGHVSLLAWATNASSLLLMVGSISLLHTLIYQSSYAIKQVFHSHRQIGCRTSARFIPVIPPSGREPYIIWGARSGACTLPGWIAPRLARVENIVCVAVYLCVVVFERKKCIHRF